MGRWQNGIAVLAVIWAAAQANAQSCVLSEATKAGDCFRIHIDMQLTGEIRVNRDGKQVPLKLEASATHDFPERVLSVGTDSIPDKTARYYETAKAKISVQRSESERSLRDQRRLIVAQRTAGRPLVYSPTGMLTRDELDLVSEHFDILALVGLLPGKTVNPGDTWKVPNTVVQSVCGFEGLAEQTLECKLFDIKEQQAHITVKGTASGIDLGAQVKLIIDGGVVFDLQTRRLIRVDWKQDDERQQGPASPASSLHTTTVLTRSAVEQPATLSDVALVSVPDGLQAPEPLTQLEYRDAKNAFAMPYARDWQSVSQDSEHVVMRLLDRGEFVSQVTLTPWTKAEPGKHLSPEEFRQAMSETPGWQPEQEIQAGEVSGNKDKYIYRISAVGQLEGSQATQNFYLIAAPDGRQLVLVFTLTPKQVDRLGTKDLALVGGIQFDAKEGATEK
jgi:hypothetical protein